MSPQTAASTTPMPSPEVLRGQVDRIVFRSESSGFTVLRLICAETQREKTLAGIVQPVREGDMLHCTGEWVHDRKWGPQFHPHAVRLEQPATDAGIIKYLSSGMIKGIGPKLAQKLVEAFGQETFKVIEEQPQRLQEIHDIGPTRAQAVVENFKAQRVVADIMAFLMEHGLGTNRAYRIYKTYGDDALKIIQTNPYNLTFDILGIGFKTTDQIALNIGVDPQSQLRASAALHYQLSEMTRSGHCAIGQDDLVKKTAALVRIPNEIVASALDEEINQERLIPARINGAAVVYPEPLYRAEHTTATNILRLIGRHALFLNHESAEVSLAKIEKEIGIELNQGQKDAVIRSLTHKVSILTGLPGTGKTTTLNTILKLLTEHNVEVVLAAPTGRAAKRMTETTQIEAKTIHRLLEVKAHEGFTRDKENPLEGDYFVIDETSMVDIRLMAALVDALPSHASLLLVGDINQLPSILPGNVLGDLIACGALPVTRLSQIYRQAESSCIVQNAHLINQGRPFREFKLDTPGESCDFTFLPADNAEAAQQTILTVMRSLIDQQGYDLIRDVQVLTPSHKSEVGTRSLNSAIQKHFNPHSAAEIDSFGYKFGLHDKVMQRVNDYDRGVFNGDLGQITAVDMEDKEVTVTFDGEDVFYDFTDLDDLMPAYCATCHKAQGMEYPIVILPIFKLHYILLERGLLYTAITRAKQQLILVGQAEAVDMAIRNIKAKNRLTNLTHLIQKDTMR